MLTFFTVIMLLESCLVKQFGAALKWFGSYTWKVIQFVFLTLFYNSKILVLMSFTIYVIGKREP